MAFFVVRHHLLESRLGQAGSGVLAMSGYATHHVAECHRRKAVHVFRAVVAKGGADNPEWRICFLTGQWPIIGMADLAGTGDWAGVDSFAVCVRRVVSPSSACSRSLVTLGDGAWLSRLVSRSSPRTRRRVREETRRDETTGRDAP